MIGDRARRRAAGRRAASTLAVRFAANNDRMHFPGAPADPAAGVTVTAWIRVDDRNDWSTFFRLYAGTGTGGSTTVTWALAADGLGGPGYYTAGGSVELSGGVTEAAWHPVAITRLGTTGWVYRRGVDGAGPTAVTSGTVAGITPPTGIGIGGRSPEDGTEQYDGRLAYVRVWTTQLAQSQIEAEWASRVPVVTSGLWADWRLQGVTDLADHSGAGRHLTAGPTAVTTEAGPPV